MRYAFMQTWMWGHLSYGSYFRAACNLSFLVRIDVSTFVHCLRIVCAHVVDCTVSYVCLLMTFACRLNRMPRNSSYSERIRRRISIDVKRTGKSKWVDQIEGVELKTTGLRYLQLLLSVLVLNWICSCLNVLGKVYTWNVNKSSRSAVVFLLQQEAIHK